MGINAVAIGLDTTASGANSFAQGTTTQATGIYSAAFGENSIANREAAFAEGLNTTAQGIAAHAEGNGSRSTANYAHSEGQNTLASGVASHAEGSSSTAAGASSHAEGSGTNATTVYAHAEGLGTTASGTASHAEGISGTASGAGSHAEGTNTQALGDSAHAEGSNTEANVNFSHAGGQGSIANGIAQTVIGRYNIASGDADAFIIGNGTGNTVRSNAFRVAFNGDVFNATGLFTNGADYAEMFEWKDQNPAREDRRGFFVTLDGRFIRKATNQDDYILGIISAMPSVIGDSFGCGWRGMYMRDEWGAVIYEWVEVPQETMVYDPVSGERQVQTKTVRQLQPKLDPKYNASQPYVSRTQRPEWAAVGLIGKIIARDDGSCEPNGFCRPNAQGIGTASGKGFRVLERLDTNRIIVCRI